MLTNGNKGGISAALPGMSPRCKPGVFVEVTPASRG
jgi:hypothetical protein